ncbi:MAG: alkaline phosphatase family protein [Candidatus Eisenbacteria bacterium]|nr:alkaline phosphatase family protein [Candidatus Eisenbacteria bacterium]
MNEDGRITGRALGFLFGVFLGLLIGAWTIWTNYLPFPGGAAIAVILTALVAYAVPFGALGLIAPLFPFLRSGGARLALSVSLAALVFSGLEMNRRLAGGALAPKSLAVDGALFLGAFLLFLILRRLFPRRIGRRLSGAAAVVVAALLVLCSVRTPPMPAPTGASPGPIDPRPVVFLGIDGMEWRIMNPLLEAGRLPNFERIIREGTTGKLETLVPTNSPLIWTTLVTGKEPMRHGINHFTVWDAPFLPVRSISFPAWSGIEHLARLFPQRPISARERRVNTLWDICGETSLPCGFVSWWASYPVVPVESFQLSSRFLFDLGLYKKSGWDYLREASGDLYPPEAREDLIARFRLPETVGAPDLKRFWCSGSCDEEGAARALEAFRSLDGWTRPPFGATAPRESEAFRLGGFLLPYLDDCSRHAQGLYLWERYGPTLFGLYIRGIDDTEHFFWHYMEPDSFPGYTIDQEAIGRYAELIPDYYVFTDSLVGEVLNRIGDDAVLLIASDHGHRPSGRLPWSGSHSFDPPPPGVFMARGAGIRTGETIRGASVYDVTPTVLDLLGLPAGEDMPGRVLTELFSAERRPPLERIPSWDRIFRGWERTVAVDEAAAASASQAEMERLKALGYVK